MGDMAIPDQHESMVDFSVSVTAVEEILGHHSLLIGCHHSSGEDSHGDGLLLEDFFELLIGLTIMLDVADRFHVDLTIQFFIVIMVMATSVFGLVILLVVFSLKDSILGHVSESLVHPATSTGIVVFIAVNKLLDRIFFKIFVLAF